MHGDIARTRAIQYMIYDTSMRNMIEPNHQLRVRKICESTPVAAPALDVHRVARIPPKPYVVQSKLPYCIILQGTFSFFQVNQYSY